MKKKLIFLLIVGFSIEAAYCQDNFTVIKVSGNIVIERTGSSLSSGTAFSQNENLLFKIPESRAAVINPQRGRYLLTSENLEEFRNSKSNFLPAAGKISTRGTGLNNKIIAPKDQFKGNYLFFDEVKMVIDTTIYPMSQKKFFYLTYDYKTRTINKKLAFKQDTLLIKRNELLTVDGKEIPDPQINQMKLVYLTEGKDFVSTDVCTFNPIFPDLKTMAKELKLLLDQMGNKTYNERLGEITAFITEFYGKPDEESLIKWLDVNLGFRK
jgi:hypothetical protein